MPNKTLYVGPRQEATWAAAEELAAETGTSLSALTTRAVREFIERAGGPGLPGEPLEVVLRRMRQQINELARHTGLDRIMSGFDE